MRDQHSSPSEDMPKSPSEDMPKSAFPILVYGGASCESSPSEAQSRKVVRLEEMKIVILVLECINAQGKGMILIGFLFTGLMMLVDRPGYKIVNCTIKRGSRPSILSFMESSNLCILAIIFIGSYLSVIMVWSWCLSCLS